jgi:hypothetical protein
VGYIGHQGLPLGVEDGCRGGLGSNLVDVTILLVGTALAKLSVCFLVVAPRHVVLAPTPGTSLDLLLVSFSLLWRGLLPTLILLLLSLVSVILLILLFLIIASTLLLVSSFVVILGSHGLLEVGGKLELAFESGMFSLHCQDLVFVW